jgi:hypothetical protein
MRYLECAWLSSPLVISVDLASVIVWAMSRAVSSELMPLLTLFEQVKVSFFLGSLLATRERVIRWCTFLLRMERSTERALLAANVS